MMTTNRGLLLGLCAACLWASSAGAADREKAPGAPEGWTTGSPRDELRPAFRYLPEGGPDHRGSFVIEADGREGLIGWWAKSFPVRGGRHFKLTVKRKATGVETPR